ncbi:MAG TPA: outer membrane protein transport protein, partial [Verrucomicrobiae bacterium]|nr:outer membrane protein transport protein [Verrucomicrobiae bacterium]
ADDASAIYYNPAGLTQLKGTQITSGAMLSFPDSRLDDAGSDAKMNTMAFLPHFYAASDFGMPESKWRFGLGVNIPYGNAAEFAKNGPFQYIVTATELAVINIEPTVAYQVNNQLSLGAGLNIYHGQTALNNHVAVVPGAPAFDGSFHFHGNGWAFGATAGLMWKITPQWTFGAVYRSPFRIDFDGDAILKTPFGNDGPHNANSAIEFPQSVAGGLAFRPIPKLKLEVDVEWTDWQTLNNVVLHSTPGAAFNGETVAFDWQDSMYYEFGAQYDITDHWVVRGGYIYSENTVPGSTFSPTVPDANRHVFSGGLGYTTRRFNVDVVYQYSLSENRHVTIPLNDGVGGTATGTWKSDGHAVMMTTTLKF